MANLEHLEILKQGVEAWNQWRYEQDKKTDDNEEFQAIQPDLSGVNLRGITLEGANLNHVNLERSWLRSKSLKNTNLSGANLKGAYLRLANLSGANLQHADLRNATIHHAKLQKANLSWARLEGASFYISGVEDANLRGVFFDDTTRLENIALGDRKRGFVHLVDIHWSDANLTSVDWSSLEMPAEEYDARQRMTADGRKKNRSDRLEEYQEAVCFC